MIQAELKIIGGKHQGKVIPLATKKFLVGREQDCHLRPNSDLVSRHHCVFTIDSYTVRLRDLGSTNGTFVNGESIKGPVVLKAGDQVSIGKLDFVVQLREVAPDESLPAAETASEAMPSDLQMPVAAESTDTLTDMPVYQQAPGDASTDTAVFSGDTSIFPVNPEQAPFPYAPLQYPPGYAMPTYPGYPPQQYPGYPPPGYPPQPGYPPPGYAPYPGQPPYGFQPPQGGYPPQPAPLAPAPAAQAPDAKAVSGSKVMPVQLPPPEQTGAQAPAPAAPASAEAKPKSGEEKSSNSAADIIRQYMQRRPG